MRKLLLLALLLLSLSHSYAQDQTMYAIINGTIIDGTGAAPLENGVVLVNRHEILAIGDAATVEIPDNVEIIDADGGSILPGVINAHTHQAVSSDARFRVFTRHGVTGICDMAMPLRYMQSASERRLDGSFAGRISFAGPIITAPGGYPAPIWGNVVAYEVSNPEEAEQAVLDLIARDAMHIKIALQTGWAIDDDWAVLTLEQVQAITQTAHEHGLMVHAHVEEAELLELALDGGVDVIQHTPIPYRAPEWGSEDEWQQFFEHQASLPDTLMTLLQRMVDEEVSLVPTLDVSVGRRRQPDVPAALRIDEPRFRVYEQLTLSVVRAFHDLGGHIALGNDYGNTRIAPGMPINEMLLLEEVGLSPMEVIVASTRNAAQACGFDNMGTLEIGNYADIIIVDGNPLEDITAMENVIFVMVNGDIVLD